MRRGSARLLLAASALPLALVLTALVVTQRNSLARNERWLSFKTGLEYGVMGAVHFVEGRQALVGERLDLGVWHGYHGLRLREPQTLAALALRFELAENAWLVLLWDDGRRGLRVSRHERFPPALLELSAEGAFLRLEPLALPTAAVEALERGPLTARIRFEDGATRLWLGEQELARRTEAVAGPQWIGFRGGRESARIDDVVLTLATGEGVREGFDARDGAAGIALGFLALLLGLEWLACRFPTRRAGSFPPEFPWVLANGVLAGVLLGFLVVDQQVLARRYKPLIGMNWLFARERHWVLDETDQISREMAARHAQAPRPGTLRVMLIGSSQTWGAGARLEEESFARRLESLLARRRHAGRPVEVLNAGVSGQKGPGLLERFRAEWVGYAPEVVILDLSNNDEDLEAFEGSLRGFARLCRERGIRLILVQEANALDRPPDLLPRHRVMERVAREEGLPLVPLHDRMARLADSGFVWWDHVHPTSYGHRLVAEILVDEVDWDTLRAPR